VPRDIARALGMNYVFGVEFVELPRQGGSGGVITSTCEHGNAVLSRYPLGNVGALRHRAQRSWYLPPAERDGKDGEPRLGGRVLVYADVKVGDEVRHAYSLHFESSPEYLDVQVAQAVETAEHAAARRFPAVVAGDTNAPFYWLDLRNGPDLAPSDEVTQAFFERGFVDAHASVPVAERGTRNGLVLDLVLGHDLGFSAPGRCAPELCGALSDHLAVWASFGLR
jgi:endonuclease/exonuclease/phosphatase family metal-dependent hydrolase